jgi:hypothetical protein
LPLNAVAPASANKMPPVGVDQRFTVAWLGSKIQKPAAKPSRRESLAAT